MAYDVERVLARLGIEYRAVGQHCQARCPYHDDHEPSWRIRRHGEKSGLHYCQACKVGGDLVALVMHVRGYGTWAAAKEWLDQFRVDAEDLRVKPVRVVVEGEREFRMPAGVVEGQLLADWPTPVRLEVERRGLDARDVLFWELGYALEGRLAGRVVVPIHDNDGKLKSYVARSFGRAPRKYLYPTTEEGPDMDVMFGEVEWDSYKRDDNARNTAVVTEGAFKSMAVSKCFVGEPVFQAALGGSPAPPREAHVAKLATFGHVVVLTDSDPPGELAGDALEAALGGHTRVSRARLPLGQDADSVPAEVLRRTLWPAICSGDHARR